MKSTRSRVNQQGFTITQMVITIAIIAIVSTFGVLGIRTARAEFRLQNNARLFASYVEKARADAIRRHAESGQESSIETFGPGNNKYEVTMDWGNGLEKRTFYLESDLSFNTAAQKVSFDWRGRITEAWVFQIRSDFLDKNLPVDVSGSGDITVGEQHFPDQLIPEVVISQVTGDVATPTPTPSPSASPTATPINPNEEPTPEPTPDIIELDPGNNGNGGGYGTGGSGGIGGGGNGNPSPTPTPTPNASPSPSPGGTTPQCVTTLSTPELNLSQSQTGNQSGTAVFNVSSPTGVRTISAAIAGNGNSLTISLSLVRVDGSGTSVITIGTKNGAGNRGSFIVNISTDPSCGSGQQLKVNVSN